MKSRVLDRTLVVIAVLGVVINVFNTVRVIYQEDLKSTYFIQLAVLTLFVLLAVFRKKVRHRTKVFVIFLIMCVAFVTGFDAFGYLAPAKIYIPIIPLFRKGFP